MPPPPKVINLRVFQIEESSKNVYCDFFEHEFIYCSCCARIRGFCFQLGPLEKVDEKNR